MKRTFDGLQQFSRQCSRFYDRMGIAGDDNVPFDGEGPFSGFLLRHPVRDALVEVVVQLVARDRPIAIQIGLAGLQSPHQRMGKDRAHALATHGIALEGILQRIGSG